MRAVHAYHSPTVTGTRSVNVKWKSLDLPAGLTSHMNDPCRPAPSHICGNDAVRRYPTVFELFTRHPDMSSLHDGFSTRFSHTTTSLPKSTVSEEGDSPGVPLHAVVPS